MSIIFKNDIYKHIYFAINHVISSYTIILYLIGKMNIYTQIKIEASLLICKWIVEILYKANSIDLIVHHLCAGTAVYNILSNNTNYFTIRSSKIFVHLHLIHISMFFYAIKSIFIRLGNKYNKIIKYSDNLYLLTWIIISPYRCFYILFDSIIYFFNGIYSIYLTWCYIILIPLFFGLDYYWTPWHKYKNLKNFFKVND